MAKKKQHNAFWKDIKFKYKLTLTDENSLEEVGSVYFTKLKGIMLIAVMLITIFALASIMIAYTPLRNYLPGYMNSEIRSQVVNNALKVDSLIEVANRQNLYIMNIQDIFAISIACYYSSSPSGSCIKMRLSSGIMSMINSSQAGISNSSS